MITESVIGVLIITIGAFIGAILATVCYIVMYGALNAGMYLTNKVERRIRKGRKNHA